VVRQVIEIYKMNEDKESFTQKDLMQHLLHAAQHSVTREEMASQFVQAEQITKDRFDQAEQITKERFDQAEQITKERFDQVDKRFEQVDKQFVAVNVEIKEQGKKIDRLTWAIFIGMLAIFFKEPLSKVLGV